MVVESFRASLLVATGGLEQYESLWGVGLQHAIDSVNRARWSDGRCPEVALTGRAVEPSNQDHVFGAYCIKWWHKGPGHKFKANGEQAIWVGRSIMTPDSSVVIPIRWDSESCMWELGTPTTATNIKVKDESFPLKEGPVQRHKRSSEMRQFLQKYQLPSYSHAENRVDWQSDPGYDPEFEVEKILEKYGSGKKVKYKVKWKDSNIKTIEPLHHLKECMDLVRDFEVEQQARKGKQKGGGKRHSANIAMSEDETHCKAVEQLLRQQRRQGTVEDWLPGYKAELQAVRQRRLRRLTPQEVQEHGVEAQAVRLRMNTEPKRDGRLKCRLLLQGFREPRSWDGGPNDSPVVSLSTIRSMLRGCVDMRLQWVRDIKQLVGTGQVQVKYVHTKDNMADVLTKCLPAWKYNNCVDRIQNNQRDRQYAQFLLEMGF